MNRFAVFSLPLALFCAITLRAATEGGTLPQSNTAQSDTARSGPAQPDPTAQVTLPAGAKVELVLTRPVRAQTAKPGDPFYTQTNFPATDGKRIAIPAGSWVQGTIEAITWPTRKSQLAVLQVLFTKIIFANGYTVALPDSGMASGGPTIIRITAEVSTSNDLLLDNGAQIEMTLPAPLSLNAGQIAGAIPITRAPEPGTFRSATLCRYSAGTLGTPGSPDTIIPGSPGTPGTTIPGGPGMPDITIPGTPATPSTMIPGIPGSSGTPDTFCPAAPIVISSVPVAMTPAQSQSSASTDAH